MMGPHDVKNMFQALIAAAEQRRLDDVARLLDQLKAAEERVQDERNANRVLSRAITLLTGVANAALTTLVNLYAMDDPTENGVREQLSSTIDDLQDEVKAAQALLGITVAYREPKT